MPNKLKREPIPDEICLATGRLALSFAEFEHLLTLHISDLLALEEVRLVILLGQSSFRNVSEITRYLHKNGTDAPPVIMETVLSDWALDGQRMRNCLCHGVYLGVDEEGIRYFRLARRLEGQGFPSLEVWGLRDDDIIAFADHMPGHLEMTEKVLRLEASRRKSLSQPLSRRPKGQPRNERREKRPPPPPPSLK